jgi:signal transduction histidine kinase
LQIIGKCLGCEYLSRNGDGHDDLEDQMPRIQLLRKCERNPCFNQSGSVDIPEHQHPLYHGTEELRTISGGVLECERSNISQKLAPFISHDIRHHLATINCNVEFMTDPDICQTDRHQLLDEVRGTIRDMTDLLDSYLLSVRTERTVHLQQNSLNLLIQHVVDMVRPHPDARECEVVICDAPSIQARIDNQRLGTAVYNLLLNACQALKGHSSLKRVEIAVQQDDSCNYIRVQDNGQGVPNSIRNVLFHPFVSVEKIGGVGLGLTIAQEAARAHGGCLILEESSPGKTVFVLQLPNHASESSVAEALLDQTSRFDI